MTLPSSAASSRPGRKKKQPRSATHCPDFGTPLDPTRWDELQSSIFADESNDKFADALCEQSGFGEAVYLWGMACGAQSDVTDVQRILARISSTAGKKQSPVRDADRDWLHEHAIGVIERVYSDGMRIDHASECVLWASAMPALSRYLPHDVWWQCGEQLLQLRADAALRSDATSPLHLMLAGELGLTLSGRLSALASCRKLTESSLEAVNVFLQGEGESIDRSVADLSQIRLIVASLIRCEKLFWIVGKRRFKKRQREIAAEFATWMAAVTRHDGSQVFSAVEAKQCRIDFAAGRRNIPPKSKKLSKKKASKGKPSANESPELHSLMHAACGFDPETLIPAMAAALGQGHSGGRLAWEVSLPEAMWHSEAGKSFAMLPEWDVRRGRTFVDYSHEDVAIEIMGGRRSLFRGTHQTMITLDGVDQRPTGGWECTCEYSDDDVHLIELEQPYSGDVVLQRQWMLVRDDRCLMLSDAVLPSSKTTVATKQSAREHADSRPDVTPEILCTSRFPLAPGVEVIEDEQTRELILTDGKKRRGLVMPLTANEWRVGPSVCDVTISEDGHLVVATRGRGRLYSPVWIDFRTHRFGRKRTWRQLTIAEELALIAPHVAAAFRVQVGSEHWVVYRSMSGRGPRSVLGKHLIADFFAARFHPGDGGMEELVTVDDTSMDDTSENQ